jgi:hypothetical protein
VTGGMASTSTAVVTDIGALDLGRYIRPGDMVLWGQACAEPLTLTELLAAQRGRRPAGAL